MIVECLKCNAKYKIDERKLGDKGKKVSCSKCKNIFTVKPEIKPGELLQKQAVNAPISPKGPVGLDIGTSHIVMATHDEVGAAKFSNQLNAFFNIPESNITKQILKDKGVNFFTNKESIYIFGFSALEFASIFNKNMRRPIDKGILSPKEKDGIRVIGNILKTMISPPEMLGEKLCLVIPGEPYQSPGSVIYHASLLKRFLSNIGFNPITLNEGMATVMAELIDTDYTGIGISMGGGMCNVCFSYLTVPIITYSIQKGGDYIDFMTSSAVGESETKIKMIKENELNLSIKPKNRIIEALNIFYNELVNDLIQSLQRAIDLSDNIPRLSRSIPIALSGGTVLPKGFLNLFKKALYHNPLPVHTSEVRIVNDPLTTTSRGALKIAIS